MRANRPGLAAVAALVAASGAVLWAQHPPQFRSGVELVRLPVVVAGKDSLIVRGLKAADFVVTEDGVPQTISAFSEGAPGEVLPLHAGLLLDVSESMEGDLKSASSAVIQFITAFDEAVDVTFVDFDNSIRLTRFGKDSYPRLFERIQTRKATGGTALYDAIGAYLATALQRGGQHVLLVYTDGGDSLSRMSYPHLIDALRFSNVIVYALGYLDNQTSTTRGILQQRMLMMARETGGDAFFPSSVKELQSVYARILDELGSRYTIGYESTNPKADGKFRKVQVKLANPDAKNVRIRTRSGYLAPVKR
jgi:Ca-activated chloride channel family protein